MKTIWKYPFVTAGAFSLELPEEARILTVQTQPTLGLDEADPCIWALVDPAPDVPREVRHFRVLGTGQAIEDDLRLQYIGTYQLHGGTFVGHLFQVLARRVPDGPDLC